MKTLIRLTESFPNVQSTRRIGATTTKPLRSLVLKLSGGGDRIEINHPDQLLVGDSTVVVGIGTAESDAASRFRIFGLDHVKSIDFNATVSSPEDGNCSAARGA